MSAFKPRDMVISIDLWHPEDLTSPVRNVVFLSKTINNHVPKLFLMSVRMCVVRECGFS